MTQWGFASDITDDEAAWGFEHVDHPVHGPIVSARVGTGLRAVKTLAADGDALYMICNDEIVMLYEPARSLFDLSKRFNLSKRAG